MQHFSLSHRISFILSCMLSLRCIWDFVLFFLYASFDSVTLLCMHANIYVFSKILYRVSQILQSNVLSPPELCLQAIPCLLAAVELVRDIWSSLGSPTSSLSKLELCIAYLSNQLAFIPQENKTLEDIIEALWIGICNLSRLQDADEVGENIEILKCYVLALIKAFCLEYARKCTVKGTKSMFKLLYFSCLDCFCEYTARNSGLWGVPEHVCNLFLGISVY